ncbi:MAG: class I SAM-dependent DNA methyltransferase [Gaiellaceae bacterium]
MSTIFSAAYADVYDALYAEKDYERECDMIERLFRVHATGPVCEVLDMGCGTGNHALPLARRGYAVTGVDRSTAMLQMGCMKAAADSTDIRWMAGDIRTVDVHETFDACLLMFAVLSYQLGNDDVRLTLETVRRHLRPGGLLVCDVWCGPGVLTDPPTVRERTVDSTRGSLTRRAIPSLDIRRHLCTVRYELIDSEGSIVSEEVHTVRYFFPLELELLLDVAGLEPLLLAPFDAPDAAVDERTWNLLVVARASAAP